MILNLRYKGNRNYLQGADIYQVVNQYFKTKGGYVRSITFREFARKQLEIKLERPNSARHSIAAEGSVSYQTGECRFWLVVTDENVNGRYPFAEDVITSAATLTEDAVYVENCLDYSLIDIIVVLCKYYCNAHDKPLLGKWIFCKLMLSKELPDYWTYLQIFRVSCLQGRFIRFSLSIDAIYFGEIHFIVATS